MSLDLQRLRTKLDTLKNPRKRTTKFEKKTWPPEQQKAGDVRTVRMVQYPFGQDPFVELFFHYDIGRGPGILCPRLNSGKTCPICEFAFSLRGSGEEADRQTARKLFPKQRIYALVVDRSDDTPVIKYWGFGKEMYQYLIEKLLSEDYGTFLDPAHGLDAEVKFDKRGDSNYVFPTVTFKRKESRLAESKQEVEELLKTIVPIEEVFRPLTTAEINERLSGWLNLNENDGDETVRGASSSSEEDDKEEVSGPSVKDLDAAFEEALQNG
jgi:hypothetical protein